MAETSSLLNCRTRKCTGGSNPPLSATLKQIKDCFSEFKVSGSPSLIESFPLQSAQRRIEELKHVDKRIYLWGTGELAQEVLYNTCLFDIENFKGLITEENDISNAYGLRVQNIQNLKDNNYCLIIPHHQSEVTLPKYVSCEKIYISEKQVDKLEQV